ncbi:MAG: winged helix-turn-helix domain-containing protein [Nitrosopumilus sp.]
MKNTQQSPTVIRHHKPELKRIDLDILERIMTVMYEAGKSNKTAISRKSNMSYDKCVKYLSCLEMLDFVKCQKEKGEDKKNIYMYDLTLQGIRLCQRRLVAKFDSHSVCGIKSSELSKVYV